MKYKNSISRRKFVKNAMVLTAAIPVAGSFARQTNTKKVIAVEPVTLKWLDSKAQEKINGTTWGVPWPKGALKKDASLVLENKEGKTSCCKVGRWHSGRMVH